MSDQLIKQLIKRLDASLSLQIKPFDEKSTDQDKIERLDIFGFSPAEIATILGSTSDKISKQLYVVRKKRKNG